MSEEHVYWEEAACAALDELGLALDDHGHYAGGLTAVIEDARHTFPDLPRECFYTDIFVCVNQLADEIGLEINFVELIDLLCWKQTMYGHENINSFGHHGLVVRLSDKIARLNNLRAMGLDPEDETIEDTFFDMLGYAIIGEMLSADTFKLPLNQHRLRLK